MAAPSCELLVHELVANHEWLLNFKQTFSVPNVYVDCSLTVTLGLL